MKKRGKLFFIAGILSVACCTGQTIDETVSEKSVSEEEETVISSELEYLKRHRLDINTATASDLKVFRIISEAQIHHFITYRKLNGTFIDLHELQSVPWWGPDLIRRLLPYVTIGPKDLGGTLKERVKNGEHSVLARLSSTIEKAIAYRNGLYAGGRERYLLKYKYRYKNLLQYGVTAEKDAGEKPAPDFTSFHIFLRNAGRIKALAIGDFSVNLGQGLLQFNSMSAGKSSEVMHIRQQADVLVPYTSSAETNFNRGIGITMKNNKWEGSGYISFTRLSATIKFDSLLQLETVTSVSVSGLHRTPAEIAKRKNTRLVSAGANVSYHSGPFRAGMNSVMHSFERPLAKSSEPYACYDPEGRIHRNLSIDISHTYRNVHGFGEAALSANGASAILSGLMVSLHQKVDIAVLYRGLSPRYHALYARAFTEAAEVNNEEGLYTGISVRPVLGVTIQAYADLFRHPFIRYRKSGTTGGADLFLQVTYQPNRRTSVYSRYECNMRQEDNSSELRGVRDIIPVSKRKWRLHYIYIVPPSFRLQARTEVVWYKKEGIDEEGLLAYLDGSCKIFKGLNATLRLLMFETGGFNSRIYAYEPDLPYSSGNPFFYGHGIRYLLIARLEPAENVDLSVKWSQTIYTGRTSVGSGGDEIPGNTRSDLRLQLIIFLGKK